MRYTITYLTFVIFVSLVGQSTAQKIRDEQKENPLEEIKKLDKNKDGRLSREEVMPYVLKAFHKEVFDADKNKDSQVDSLEIRMLIRNNMLNLDPTEYLSEFSFNELLSKISPQPNKTRLAGILLRRELACKETDFLFAEEGRDQLSIGMQMG